MVVVGGRGVLRVRFVVRGGEAFLYRPKRARADGSPSPRGTTRNEDCLHELRAVDLLPRCPTENLSLTSPIASPRPQRSSALVQSGCASARPSPACSCRSGALCQATCS